MSRPVRRVGFYGYLGSGNIGNDATFETVLAWLESAHPEVEVRCITIAPGEVTDQVRCPVRAVVVASHGSGRQLD